MEAQNINAKINYNKLLDVLFESWIESYDEKDRERFCHDGLMRKNSSELDINELWHNAKRRVMFILKDCPDGWGYDTRDLLQQQDVNELRHGKFFSNLAKLFYGILRNQADDRWNDKRVDADMQNVIKAWQTEPFAFIEAKKLAGDKNVLKQEMESALKRDESFLKKELDILKPNIIVCCGADDSQFDFITKCVFANKTPKTLGSQDYPSKSNPSCLHYYPEDEVAVIKSYHPSAIKEEWMILERVFSPFSSLLHNYETPF